MANLAATCFELDELSQARRLEVEVLDWRKVHLGLKHPETILVMHNLAYTFRKLGEINKAEELLAQVKELRDATECSHPEGSTEGVVSSPSAGMSGFNSTSWWTHAVRVLESSSKKHTWLVRALLPATESESARQPTRE
jgi:hypothetical protein